MTLSVGSTYQDPAGLTWKVKSRRSESPEQFVVEADIGGDYARRAIYVMTAGEFETCVQQARLRPIETRATAAA